MGTSTKTRRGGLKGKGPKSSLVGAETVQKPSQREQAPLHWLDGQREDGVWTPLYCSRRPAAVRAWYLVIIELPDDHDWIVKEGLDVFEDFRVRTEDE